MIEMLNSKKLEYKVGLRLLQDLNLTISLHMTKNMTRGYILEMKKFHPKGEWHIIIDWKDFGKVQYTKKMLDEAFTESIIKIDKGFYRNQKLEQLGI